MKFELSRTYHDWLKEAIENDRKNAIIESLEGVKHIDISTLLDDFNSQDSKYVIGLLNTEVSAKIINELDNHTRNKFLNHFTSLEIGGFINHLKSDDAVDLLQELPVKTREEVISNIEDDEKATYIIELLHYDDNCAGGLMGKELIKANVNWTVDQCIEEIRRQAENVEKIYSVYVVDDSDILLGRVSTKKIILSHNKTKVANIFEENIISILTYLQDDEVADIMQKYDLDSAPVVNVKGQLVGRITIDDIVDVITEIAEHDIKVMSGISEDVEENDSIIALSRARLPWLIIGMLGGMIGAQLISMFEKEIALIPAMAFFIPLIMATGGNAGIQSSTIIVQGLANKSMIKEYFWKRIIKMSWVSVINGVVLTAIVFVGNILLGQDNDLTIIVSIALFCVILLSSFLGTITPILLEHFGINPALASGPFITTANDLLGLSVYFSIAYFLYSS